MDKAKGTNRNSGIHVSRNEAADPPLQRCLNFIKIIPIRYD